MAKDLSYLLGKIENQGTTNQGKLSANEFNDLIEGVVDLQQNTVRSISYNNGTAFSPDDQGNVNLLISESNYILSITTKVDGTIPYRIALGSSFKMRISISNKFMDGDEQVSVSTPCKVTFYHGATNKVVGELTGYDGQTVEFDFGKHFTEGLNTIWARVDNGYGAIKDTMAYSVEAIYLQCLLPAFDKTAVQSGDWELQVSVLGATAHVYLFVDGDGGLIGTQSAGSTVSYKVGVGHGNGTHKLRVYAAYAEDASICTPEIVEEFIYENPGMTSTAIATSLLDGAVAEMYSVLTVPFWVYIPGFSGTKEVKLSVFTDLNTLITSTTRTVTFTNGRTGELKYDISLFDASFVGERQVCIECNGEKRYVIIIVNESEVSLTEVSGYDLCLTSAGRSNSDDNYNEWRSGQYAMSFPEGFEFNDTGSGWQRDKDGNIALHIRRGHEVTLDYFPFQVNPAFGNGEDVPGTKTGLTISIELATRSCVTRDASVVRCIHKGVGFEVLANSLNFASDSEGISANFKEDTHVRIDLVIEGRETIYNYIDGSEIKQSAEAFMWVFVDGVYQKLQQITSTSNFMQEVAQSIKFGSDDCAVDLYLVRAYRSALNFKNIGDNYAYDTPKTEDKISIAKRNDVFDSAMQVDYLKLRAARPDLPIMVLTSDILPATKDWIDLPAVAFDNPGNPNNFDQGAASFTSTGDKVATRGTSSTQYPMPYHNYGIKFQTDANGNGTILINGVVHKKWKLYLGSPEGSSIDLKKDYASSEQANNAIMSMLFNSMCVAAGQNGYDSLIAAQSNISLQNYRQSLYAIPIYIFQYTGGKYVPIGMFNLISYKTDDKVLGFVSPYTWAEQRAQSWEVRDNNVFYDSIYNPPHVDEDGNIVNDAFQYYESLYPKDSTAFDGQDFGSCVDDTQLSVAIDETKDILRLHNWLSSTNRLTATNKLLDAPVTLGGETYTYDNARYRLAKFVAEAEDYIFVDHYILRFLWMKTPWMMDNGSKNMGHRTDDASVFDKTKWRPTCRDCDTGLEKDNVGKLHYPPYLELCDYELAGQFILNQSSMPEGATTILNGQNSALWQNLKDGFSARVQAMYVWLRSNSGITKFGYNELESWFEEHQAAWSEALYNFGSNQYHGGAPYTKWVDSGCGDSKNQRRYWLFYRYLYMDSKYHYVSTEATECISWRGQCNGCDLQMKAYAPMYLCLGFGATGYAQTTRYRYTDLNSYVTIKNELKQQTQNAIFYLFNGRFITELGDLYKFGNIQELNLASAIRLKILRLGIHTDKVTRQYVNTMQQTLNLSACVAMQILDLTNCEGFGNGGNYVLDCSTLVALEEFYGYGSSLTGVTFAQTPTLNTIELGAMMRQLRLIGLSGLEHFSIQGVGALTALTVTGTPSIDTYALAERCASAQSPLASVSLDNIHWSNAQVGVLDYLSSVKSCSLKGYIKIAGSYGVNFESKQVLIQKFGNIDDASNPLHIEYNVRTIDSITVTGDDYIRKAGSYQFRCIPNTGYGNDFVDIVWSVTENSYATVDPKTGLLTVSSVGSETTKPSVTLTCKMTKTDGTFLVATRSVGLYDRAAKVGDYVFADGSYSDLMDSGKTLVGICFYIDPKDPSRRLAVACKNLTDSMPWGLYPNDFSGLALQENPDYSVFDISSIMNLTATGMSGNISDTTYRDTATGDADGFRIFTQDQVAGDLRWVELTEPLGVYQTGDKIPVGLYKTLCIIRHRDIILQDPAVNLPLPQASADQTKLNSLIQLLAEVQDTYGAAKYRQYYYPAASYCNAYEPSANKPGEVLSDKFKAGRWFLPAGGELARLCYYHLKGYVDGVENAIFAKAFIAGYFTKFNNSNYWSSTEYSGNNSWYINFGDGSFNTGSKGNGNQVRGVVAF